ncbi:hypothetical protein [Erwinia sp.]|uniref:hypothetical protein n=1 Tax=Erwinia citreus TaxID=558 RepID=UPI0028A0E525|nr:hypothetical protein [Erwinia sp.]
MSGINALPSTLTTAAHSSGQATSSQEARARGAGGAGPSTAVTTPEDAARERAIDNMVTQLNHYFPGSDGLQALVRDRATELHDMEETSHDVAENMAKGQQLDLISEAAGNAVKAFPFAISGYASGALKLAAGIDGASPGSEALAGAVDGATAMVMKAVGDKVFANTTKDTLWLAADAEKLEPEMQEVLKKRQGLGESLKLAPLGSQGFNGRNAVVGAVAVASHNNPQAVSHTSNVLSLAAGAAGGVLTNKFSASHGPEYLLGRTDWKAQYNALKATSVKQQVMSGGAERLKTLLLSVMTPRNYAKGVLNIASGNMVSEIGTLALSLAGNNALRNVARNPGVSGAVSSAPSGAIDDIIGRLTAGQLTSPTEIAKDQAINLVGAALAYAFQGVAGALAGPPPTRNDEAVDLVADKIVNSLVGQKTGELRDDAVDLLKQGATGAQQKASQFKDKASRGATSFAQGAVNTRNAMGDGMGRLKNDVTGAMSNAQQWTAEQLRKQFATSPQPGAQTHAATSGQPAVQASSSRPAGQPATQASTSQPAAQTTAQASTSRPDAQPTAQTSTPQPTAQTSTPQPAAQTSTPRPAAQPAAQASTSRPAARPTTQASSSRPAPENIEMQPMGKSKQA